jgi:hypothetical protein
MNFEEKRRHPRYLVDVPGRLTVGGASFDVRLRDICEEGVLIETPQPRRVGETVTLATEILEGSGPIEISGRIVRIAGPDEGGGPGVAVLFTSLNPAALTQIGFFLELQE